MKVYKDYSFEQEFDLEITLQLKVDGQFSYYKSYSSYGGGFVREVHGKWRQDGDAIILTPESVGKYVDPDDWTEGRERTAVEQDGFLKISGGETLELQPEKPSPENADS